MWLAEISGSGESASSKLSPVLTARCTDMTAEPTVAEGSAGDDVNEVDLTEYLSGVNATSGPEEAVMQSLWPVAAGLAMALLLTAVLLGIFIWHCKKKEAPGANKKDAFIDDGIAGHIPAPVFEDDVPSVLELDMEDLDNWGMKTLCDGYEAHD